MAVVHGCVACMAVLSRDSLESCCMDVNCIASGGVRAPSRGSCTPARVCGCECRACARGQGSIGRARGAHPPPGQFVFTFVHCGRWRRSAHAAIANTAYGHTGLHVPCMCERDGVGDCVSVQLFACREPVMPDGPWTIEIMHWCVTFDFGASHKRYEIFTSGYQGETGRASKRLVKVVLTAPPAPAPAAEDAAPVPTLARVARH